MATPKLKTARVCLLNANVIDRPRPKFGGRDTWPDGSISFLTVSMRVGPVKLKSHLRFWFICRKFTSQRTSNAVNDQFRPSERIQLLCVVPRRHDRRKSFSKWFACVYILAVPPTYLRRVDARKRRRNGSGRRVGWGPESLPARNEDVFKLISSFRSVRHVQVVQVQVACLYLHSPHAIFREIWTKFA